MATGFSAPQPTALPRALFTATGLVLSATLNSQSGFNLQETSRHLPQPQSLGVGASREQSCGLDQKARALASNGPHFNCALAGPQFSHR